MRHGEPRNFVQPCLLLLLLEHPDHGYALVERLKSFLLPEGDPGSVYRALHSLEVGGAVRSTWGLSEAGPARRTYHLTDIGQAQLQDWAQSISDTREALETYLTRYAAKATTPPASTGQPAAGPPHVPTSAQRRTESR